jgi:uncharacterized membrane protein
MMSQNSLRIPNLVGQADRVIRTQIACQIGVKAAFLLVGWGAGRSDGIRVTIILFGYNVAVQVHKRKFLRDSMKFLPVDLQYLVARRALLFFLGLLCLSILAAPFLTSLRHPVPAAVFYLSFSTVCHQIPERCFTLLGYPLAVCQRCSGIYFGLWIGALLYPAIPEIIRCRVIRRSWVLGAIIFLALDAGLALMGLWTNTPLTRFASGMVFGASSSILLLTGIAEFLRDRPWKQQRVCYTETAGGVQ